VKRRGSGVVVYVCVRAREGRKEGRIGTGPARAPSTSVRRMYVSHTACTSIPPADGRLYCHLQGHRRLPLYTTYPFVTVHNYLRYILINAILNI